MSDQSTLFDLPAAVVPNEAPADWRPEQLRTMHREYGVRSDLTCGTCVHCALRPGGSKDYYKCTRYGRFTHGSGTDWRKKWPACGAYIDASVHPLPAGWVLLRGENGRWQASNGLHATWPYATEIEAIEAAQQAVELYTVERRQP